MSAGKSRRGLLKKLLLISGLVLTALLLAVGVVAYHPDIPADELERRYADSDSQFLDIKGSRVHFKDVGSPDLPALLLVHGTASSLHTWDGWADQLGERFRILRLDLPGYGLTGPNAAGEDGRGDYSIRYRLEVIDALMAARGVDRLAVAGNSLGGLIAWRYAAEYPERVAATILVNAAGAPRGRVQEEDASADETSENAAPKSFRVIDLVSMPVVNQLMTSLTPRFLIRDALRQVYGDPSKVSEALIDRHHAMLLREGNRRAMVDAASQRTLTSRPPVEVSQVSQPSLVMWGRLDSWIPVADAERFHAALPDSELVIYEHAGHVPMEEIPAETAAATLDFLERRYGISSEATAEVSPEVSSQAAPDVAANAETAADEAAASP